MKILHTADWHLGKYLNNQSLLEDQKFILRQLLELIRKENPDVVLIAGDLYDRSVPPAEAVSLFDDTIHKIISEYRTPVIAIAGNHDSADRIHCYSNLLEKQGFYIRGKLKLPIKPIILNDEHGPVHFYAVPYTEPEQMRYIIKDAKIRSHEDVMRYLITEIFENIPKNVRSVCIAHAFITGGDPSESERMLTVGGAETVSAQLFDAFSYSALGHLHRPQQFLDGRVIYSGSPLKYSFSEADNQKSVTIIQLDGLGLITVNKKELKPRRDLRKVQGIIQKAEFHLAGNDEDNPPSVSDFLEVSLLNETPVIDAMKIIQKKFPNTLKLQWPRKNPSVNEKTFTGESLQKMSPAELFGKFYEWLEDEALSEKSEKIIQETVQEAMKEDDL